VPIDWDANVLQPLEDVFAEAVNYTTAAGVVVPDILGVFDAAYRDVDLTDPLGTTTIVPVLGVRLALFVQEPAQDDVVQVPSVNTTYVVREVRKDGHGWAKLMLGKMSSP
jgi:hypothetical protein